MTIKPSLATVKAADAGMRLDAYLARRLPAHSRSFFGRLIAEGRVLVNEKNIAKDAKVKSGDAVSVRFTRKEEISLAPDSTVLFRVLADEKDFAVIEKPAGVVVHPSDTHKKGTLVNGLLARWPEIKGIGEDAMRPGIVHRLDKETSGVMVVAKTPAMFSWLKKQFQDRKVEKKYTALVFGRMARDRGVISAAIGRRGMRQVTVGNGARKESKTREAETEYRVLASYKDATLVEASPKTGRMHQIRVHCKHIGHPVVGDKTYASANLLKLLPCDRQFLHASFLSFVLPDGRKVEFFSPLPDDLKSILRNLHN